MEVQAMVDAGSGIISDPLCTHEKEVCSSVETCNKTDNSVPLGRRKWQAAWEEIHRVCTACTSNPNGMGWRLWGIAAPKQSRKIDNMAIVAVPHTSATNQGANTECADPPSLAASHTLL
jgi:hypothetical protein